MEGDALSLVWADGHRSRFHYVWLRDHCPSLFDADTRQRAIHHLHIERNIAPVNVSVSDSREEVKIEWPSEDVSAFQTAWLRQVSLRLQMQLRD